MPTFRSDRRAASSSITVPSAIALQPARRLSGSWRRLSAGAAAALLVGALVLAGAQRADATTYTFNGGNEQTYTVPAGVTSVDLFASGGAGQASGSASGGLGAIVGAGPFAVTPGQVLYIEVGSVYDGETAGQGGAGGGASFTGAGGNGGSGADVRTCSNSVCFAPNDTRLVVAGGGGGAGGPSSTAPGSSGGGIISAPFGGETPFTNAAGSGIVGANGAGLGGGFGGTGSHGGGGGATNGDGTASDGVQGSIFLGGDGGSANGANDGGGGGGGGGYYAGGGGAGGTGSIGYGGGGGSSFISSLAPQTTFAQVGNTGGPSASVDPGPADTTPPTITLNSPADGATYSEGQAVIASYSCADESGGSGLASCTGTVTSGSAISTAGSGTQTFTVTAKDHAGNTTTKSLHYAVNAPSGAGITPGGEILAVVPTALTPARSTASKKPACKAVSRAKKHRGKRKARAKACTKSKHKSHRHVRRHRH
jgi:hypothetical protein